VAFNFQELFMKFSLEGKEIELRGITGKPGKVISSNGMTKLLKKGHRGIIAQLCSLDVQTSKPSIPQYLQRIIDKHSKVFEYIPKGLPPTRNHDHEIHLIPGSVPPNIRPYINMHIFFVLHTYSLFAPCACYLTMLLHDLSMSSALPDHHGNSSSSLAVKPMHPFSLGVMMRFLSLLHS
jgi:hypothetical protein